MEEIKIQKKKTNKELHNILEDLKKKLYDIHQDNVDYILNQIISINNIINKRKKTNSQHYEDSETKENLEETTEEETQEETTEEETQEEIDEEQAQEETQEEAEEEAEEEADEEDINEEEINEEEINEEEADEEIKETEDFRMNKKLSFILQYSGEEKLNKLISKWITQLEDLGYNLHDLSDNKKIYLINQLVENS